MRKFFKTEILCLAVMLLSVACAYGAERSEYWRQRVSLFELLPIESQDIVFLGNSITDGGEFSELFQNPSVKNRGINSDDIEGVCLRLPQIIKGKPSKIFLLIGINDISHGLSVEQLSGRYEKLVRLIKESTPSTTLYLQSVMPINNDFGRYKNLKGKEETIKNLNTEIKRLAERYNATYIDLNEALAVPGTDKLSPDFTNDGLHLMGEGYLAWSRFINKYINE